MEKKIRIARCWSEIAQTRCTKAVFLEFPLGVLR